MSPSSSRGHPDHGRRENPPATVTTSAQSEHRPGEKCRQFHSIRHLAINGSCFEFPKAVVLPLQLKFESLPGGNLFYPHGSSPATVALRDHSGKSFETVSLETSEIFPTLRPGRPDILQRRNGVGRRRWKDSAIRMEQKGNAGLMPWFCEIRAIAS